MPPPSARIRQLRADTTDTTALLAAARDGDRHAYDEVFERVYDELKRVASRQASRLGGGATMSTTALVHEAYLKLVGNGIAPANDRIHFFALASRAMRQILIDHARRRSRSKRGAANVHLDIGDPGIVVSAGDPLRVDDILALDRAIAELAAVDPDLERLVEWRFFAGLTLKEISVLSGSSERTTKRHWQAARAFLSRALGKHPPPASADP